MGASAEHCPVKENNYVNNVYNNYELVYTKNWVTRADNIHTHTLYCGENLAACMNNNRLAHRKQLVLHTTCVCICSHSQTHKNAKHAQAGRDN